MSLETWRAEFYPKPASQTTVEEAIDHSLQKWLGLLPENLAKHQVKVLRGAVVGEDGSPDSLFPSYFYRVDIGACTCSLCHHYLADDPTSNDEGEEVYCESCPLYKIRGDVACDDERDDEPVSPWHKFSNRSDSNPEPMIFWLKKAKEAQ